MKNDFFFPVLCIVVIALLIVFSVAPLMFLIHKWDDVWRYIDYKSQPVSTTTLSADEEWDRSNKAFTDCKERAMAYYNTAYVATVASTSDSYKTYECVAVKEYKLPAK